jgi:hypothetical protein
MLHPDLMTPRPELLSFTELWMSTIAGGTSSMKLD